MADEHEPTHERRQWFGPKETWLGFGPIAWQGRCTVALYVFLVVVAVFLYSNVSTVFTVVAFYTVGAGVIVFFTSDLRDRWPQS